MAAVSFTPQGTVIPAVGQPKSAGSSAKSGTQTPGGGMHPYTVDERPSTAERLTPMPAYMWPVTHSDPKHFKKLQGDLMMDKLVRKRSAKKEQNCKTRTEAKSLARKIPIDILAHDWLNKEEETVENRAFLVAKVMPSLVMGLEKLLIRAQQLNLEQTAKPDRNFNPINFLAQFLMRNNPKYTNFFESSPYVRGLRAVGEELKKELFDLEENRLVRIKAEARHKREEREELEKEQAIEDSRREDSLTGQFKEWLEDPDQEIPEPKLELSVVQNALRSFSEMAEQYPEPLLSMAKKLMELGPTDDTGEAMKKADYIQMIKEQAADWPSELFDQLVRHLSSCASSHRTSTRKEQRRSNLEELFLNCDRTGVGLLDRHRVLNLFEMFYDKATPSVKQYLANPRAWPVIDVQEIPDDVADDLEDYVTPVVSQISVDQAALAAEGEKDEEEGQEEEEEGEEEKKEGEEGEEVKDHQAVKIETETDEVTEAPVDATATDEEKKQEEEKEAEKEEEETKDDSDEKEEEDGEEEKKSEEALEEKAEEATAKEEEDKEEKEKDTAEEELEPELQNIVSAVADADKPPMTQQSKVSFADGTAFEREKSLLTSQGTRSQSQISAFDENTLNRNQFVQLVETFLDDASQTSNDNSLFSGFLRYLREGYVETEDERMERLVKARQEQDSAKRKVLINSIFDMWDNEGSGYLDLEDVLVVMKKYKDGLENEAIDKAATRVMEEKGAKKNYKSRSRHYDNRLSKREFREFVYKVVGEMKGADNFEYFVEFLFSNVERSYQERVRGEARKKWLQQIVLAGETSGAQMEPIYKTVFASIYKDADAHGQGKKVSSYIGLLEKNTTETTRGDVALRYVAATIDHCDKVLNKILYNDVKNVTFSVLSSGKPIHVPRVNTHGSVFFWDPNHVRSEEHDGALIVVPLKDRNKRIFGVLGVDTLNDPQARAIFITHEIQFLQGIAKAFSIAYHHADVRQKTMRISESAISWIARRSPNVREIVVFMVEPDGQGTDYVLRRMMNTDEKGMAKLKRNPDRLERKDNLFRDYLFKCVDNSESISADAYGERHLAIPLRDNAGKAIVVMDICIGEELKALPRGENREVMKMIKLLQMAYKEISKELEDETEDSSTVIEGDLGTGEENRADILFDRLMLGELRENLSKMDTQGYSEMKSYKEPPPVVHLILQALFGILYSEQAGDFKNWENCKRNIVPGLSSKILAFDPTSSAGDVVDVDAINALLDEVPHGMVSKHGSIPAQHIYNWVFVCVSLIEHTRKMRATRGDVGGEEKEKEEPEPVKPPEQEKEKTSNDTLNTELEKEKTSTKEGTKEGSLAGTLA